MSAVPHPSPIARPLGGAVAAMLLLAAATLAPRWFAASWGAVRADPLDVGALVSLLASAGFLVLAARLLLGLALLAAGAALGRRGPGARLARCGVTLLPSLWKPAALIVAGSLLGTTLAACSPPAEQGSASSPAGASSPAWAVTRVDPTAAPTAAPGGAGGPGWHATSEPAPRQNPAPRHTEQTSPPPGAGAHRPPPRHRVVERGDTLWSLAAESLAAERDGEPGAAAIAAESRRWFSANRRIIGDDPNLLIPGQRLIDPEG